MILNFKNKIDYIIIIASILLSSFLGTIIILNRYYVWRNITIARFNRIAKQAKQTPAKVTAVTPVYIQQQQVPIQPQQYPQYSQQQIPQPSPYQQQIPSYQQPQN